MLLVVIVMVLVLKCVSGERSEKFSVGELAGECGSEEMDGKEDILMS